MAGPQPSPIELTERQQRALERIAVRETSEQRLVRRSRIILEIALGGNNTQVARHLGLHPEQVRTWRRRWWEASPRLRAAEEEVSDKELPELVETVLSDAPRPGAPAKFSPEQVVRIRAIACEKLDEEDESSRPISHWTPREVRDEAIERGIVGNISVRTVGRFLKGGLCSRISWSTG